MTGLLLETKLYPPQLNAGVIARPRLGDRLARATSTPVTLVSAPAGFGKTTLLAGLAADAAEAGPVAWLSVDIADRDGGQFWAYLVEAIDRAIPGSGTRARTLLSGADPRVEAVLAALINDLRAIPRDLLVVIDDYHLVDDPAIQAGMAFLVDHLPPPVHVVLGTRADPALPLARLRATGRLLEIRAAELRFSSQEASAYLNGSMDLALGVEEVEALEARTEG